MGQTKKNQFGTKYECYSIIKVCVQCSDSLINVGYHVFSLFYAVLLRKQCLKKPFAFNSDAGRDVLRSVFLAGRWCDSSRRELSSHPFSYENSCIATG